MIGDTEFDADLERRISEDQAAERERAASKRRYRFAEDEPVDGWVPVMFVSGR